MGICIETTLPLKQVDQALQEALVNACIALQVFKSLPGVANTGYYLYTQYRTHCSNQPHNYKYTSI